MPIIRYFVFVGGLLLAVLFVADRYLPAPVQRAGPSDLDRTIIRIAAARTLPEKIVFDTRPRADLPTITQADSPEEPRQQVREAMAANACSAGRSDEERGVSASLRSGPPASEALGQAAEKDTRPASRLRAGRSICWRMVVNAGAWRQRKWLRLGGSLR
ncbi:hypothetical protein [Bradyrhizobium sp. STM 3561]|uniref:hypothetical protein n=1 Tax=Bradyrhizobium sp. STM 3561 TaxID=578923 RepID=UPI00388D0A7C